MHERERRRSLVPADAGTNSISASTKVDARRAQRAPGRGFSPDKCFAGAATAAPAKQ
jgi:hypothetical protein